METSGQPGRSLAETLTGEHQRLDDLFGRFLAAAQSGSLEESRNAIALFDDELRRHTALEEQRLLPKPAGQKLVPSRGESEEARLLRELLLEHVQIREISGMILRHLSERADLASARALAGNLARRWDAHTTREERELFPRLKE